MVRLREWRERRGLSLRQLADEAGVSWTTLHRIESGTLSPSVNTLEKLAGALAITVRDFFPVESKPQPRRRPKA